MIPENPFDALKKAVEVLGGQTALAKACGGTVKQQHVYNWLHRDKSLPVQYAIKVQDATAKCGDEIPAWVLRPDVFPRPEKNETDRKHSAA